MTDALARQRPSASTSRRSPAPPDCTPTSCAASWPSACSTPRADAAGELWFPPAQLAAAARVQRLRAGFAPQLRRARARARPARPHRRARGAAATASQPTAPEERRGPERLTQKSQEALHDAQTKALRFGHTEVDGEHLLLALLDQPDGLVPRLLVPGGRRPAPAARRARGGARPPAAGERARRGAGPGLRHPAAVAPARRRRARGQAAEGRVRLGRAPRHRAPRRGRGDGGRPAAARSTG